MTQDHWSDSIAYYYQSMGPSLRLPPNSELIRDLTNYKYKRRENMVDLKNAREGQIAYFICGGSAKIIKTEGVAMQFEGGVGEWWSHQFLSSRSSPFSIVRLEDAPFEWKHIKPGMAFKYRDQTVYYCFSDNRGTRYYSMESFSCPQIIYPDIGDRVPQYDIKGIHDRHN